MKRKNRQRGRTGTSSGQRTPARVAECPSELGGCGLPLRKIATLQGTHGDVQVWRCPKCRRVAHLIAIYQPPQAFRVGERWKGFAAQKRTDAIALPNAHNPKVPFHHVGSIIRTLGPNGERIKHWPRAGFFDHPDEFGKDEPDMSWLLLRFFIFAPCFALAWLLSRPILDWTLSLAVGEHVVYSGPGWALLLCTVLLALLVSEPLVYLVARISSRKRLERLLYAPPVRSPDSAPSSEAPSDSG